MSSTTHRFAVLLHRVGPGSGRTDRDHLDWMWQVDDNDLWTWSTPIVDFAQVSHANFEIDAVAIADHRQRYLDYEGELSDNRGRVDRVAAGSFEIVGISAGAMRDSLVARILESESDAFRCGDVISFQRILVDSDSLDAFRVSVTRC
jgi:hypothetical protein